MAKQKTGIIFPIQANYRAQDYDLSSVTPEIVRDILRGNRTGRLDDQDRLFRLMLDTWPRLRKARNEIAGTLKRLPFDVQPAIRPGQDDPTPEAEALSETVSRALDSYAPKPGAWELDRAGMIDALVDSYLFGISALEIAWQMENGLVSPRCYCPVPARYLAYPYMSGQTDRLMLAPQGYTSSTLEDFPADRFIVAVWQNGGRHPIYSANARALAKHWLGYVYGHGWLMQFAQLFGIPWRTVKTDGTPEAMTAAATAMDEIGANGYGVFGPGTEFEIHDGVSGSADSMPQSHIMDVADRACDILLLGQTLTTDNTGTGSRALGEIHADVRIDILRGIAEWMGDIITTQLIPAIVRMNYGNSVAQEDMPYCRLTLPEAKDDKAAAEAVKLAVVDIGLDVPKAWAHDRLGIPEPKDGEAVLGQAEIDPAIQAARSDIDTRPTEAMIRNAERALEIRRNSPPSNRGMTQVGIARARDISGGVSLSEDTIRRMKAFFDRHQGTKPEGDIEDSKWQQAWLGWGGDEGRAWAEAKLEELDTQ